MCMVRPGLAQVWPSLALWLKLALRPPTGGQSSQPLAQTLALRPQASGPACEQSM